MWVEDNHLPWNYRVCRDCGKIVKVNKFLFGALHFCVDDSQSMTGQQREWAIQQQIQAAANMEKKDV